MSIMIVQYISHLRSESMLAASSLSSPSYHILSYLFVRVESLFLFNVCTISIMVAIFLFVKCLFF